MFFFSHPPTIHQKKFSVVGTQKRSIHQTEKSTVPYHPPKIFARFARIVRVLPYCSLFFASKIVPSTTIHQSKKKFRTLPSTKIFRALRTAVGGKNTEKLCRKTCSGFKLEVGNTYSRSWKHQILQYINQIRIVPKIKQKIKVFFNVFWSLKPLIPNGLFKR